MPQSVESDKLANRVETRLGSWVESTMGVLYVVGDRVQFCDDFDHWRNAFCRLLEIPEARGREFVEQTVVAGRELFGRLLHDLSEEERVECLKHATTTVLYGGKRPVDGTPMQASWGTDLQGAGPDRIYAHSVSGDKSRIVVGNSEHQFAWLIDASSNLPVRAESIDYGQNYWSSDGEKHYGMKHYVAQSDWRLEKARRLVHTVIEKSGEKGKRWQQAPSDVSVLDVGAGLGYFRKAFDELGYPHYGVDISSYINQQCKAMFGFDTWECDFARLDEMAKGRKFDIITMWELIEHVESAEESVRVLKEFLAPGGVIVARTPNLDALEYDILGDYYYSFKFEHVKYFSPLSFDVLMSKCGLRKVYLETSSHLFKGVCSPGYLYNIGQSLRGADILAIYSS